MTIFRAKGKLADKIKKMANGIPIHKQTEKPYKLHLKQHQSPGDILTLTAAVRSLKLSYPNLFRIGVDTTCQQIWDNNPDVELIPAHECHIIDVHCHRRPPSINESHLPGSHFIQAWCADISGELGLPLTPQVMRPCLHLSTEEASRKWFEVPYFVINAGVKTDYTCKGQGAGAYQAVVDHFRGRLLFVQIGEKNPSHIHPPLKNVVSMIGKTQDCRELFSLCNGSGGGIGGITFLGHVMAALGKPYVCVAGGRESPHWTHYGTQQTLSTVGQLPCCSDRGCWKSRVVKLNDGDRKDSELCLLPVLNEYGDTVPKCMEMINPTVMIAAIERYIQGGMIKL